MSRSVEEIAKVCHQTNKAFCEIVGDYSQKDWEVAEQWQRDSAINGVKFRLTNPDCTSEDQHDAWMRDKRANGWTYGLIKDVHDKTHPCLVPYNELPVEQRMKDHLFGSVVGAMSGD